MSNGERLKRSPTTAAARSGAALQVLQEQLSQLAAGIPEPALARPLQYFGGLIGWSARTLEEPARAAAHRPALDELRKRAWALLAGQRAAVDAEDLDKTMQALVLAAEDGLVGARPLLDELLGTLTRIEEGEATGPSAENQSPRLSAGDVSAYLRQRFGEAAVADSVTYIEGGYSKNTILISAMLAGEPQEIVLRQVPPGRHEDDLPLEFDVLRKVWSPGQPIPEPLWLEETDNALGGPFFASSKAPGSVLGTVFGATEPVPETFCADLAEFLANLHAIDPSSVEKAPVLPMRNAQEIADAIDALAEKFETAVGPMSPRLSGVLTWLRANIPRFDGNPVIVHGDVGLHNALASEGNLSAVLDWERAHFGDPVEDLAYLRPSLEGVYPWEDFLDRYVAAGGGRPDPAVERFYTVWQDVWRHVECMILGEDFFGSRAIPMAIAGFVLGPRFLAGALRSAFGHGRLDPRP